ncbi:MAG: GNAT family N-acetyltransferase [Syntrophomonas sp.]
MNYEIKIMRSIEEIEHFRNAWEKLQWHPDGDIDRFLMLLKARKEILRPHVLCLLQNGIPLTMIIGRIEKVQLSIKFGYKSLLKPNVRSLTVGCGGIIGETPENICSQIISELCKSLAGHECDILFLQAVRTDTSFYECVKSQPKYICRDHHPVPSTHWRIILPSTYEEYLNIFSKKRKHNIKTEANRIKKNFGDNCIIKCYREEKDIDVIIKDQEEIASKTYHRALGVGFVANDGTKKWYQNGLSRGLYRSYILYINESPKAFFDGVRYGDTVYLANTGYDSEYEYYHLGTFLLLHIVKNLCGEEGVKAIDFGLGDAKYKSFVCNDSWQEADIYICAPTLRSIAINTIRLFTAVANQWSKDVLKRYDLEVKIKNLWRGKLLRKYFNLLP